MKKYMIASVMITALFGAVADEAADNELVREDERGKWRVGIGCSLIGPVKSNLGINGAALRAASGFGSGLAGRSRSAAYAAGFGNGGRRDFDGGAFYDPGYSGNANDPDWSWNWRLHDPSAADIAAHGKAFVERTEYREVTFSDAGGYSSAGDEGWMPGLRVEFARELYSDDDHTWGVDCAIGFAYYFERSLWKTSGTAATARMDEGRYEWVNSSYDTAGYILDYEAATQLHGGMWGSGQFGVPGAQLAGSQWQSADVLSRSSTYALKYDATGDYRELGIDFAVRPWYEFADWCRVFGTLGIEVARREFNWQFSAYGSEGSSYREGCKVDDWFVAGLLGGGLAFQFHDFVISGEALWRFGGSDLDVGGNVVRGELESAQLSFRVMLGYEF